jgi:hypothetical protein
VGPKRLDRAVLLIWSSISFEMTFDRTEMTLNSYMILWLRFVVLNAEDIDDTSIRNRDGAGL